MSLENILTLYLPIPSHIYLNKTKYQYHFTTYTNYNISTSFTSKPSLTSFFFMIILIEKPWKSFATMPSTGYLSAAPPDTALLPPPLPSQHWPLQGRVALAGKCYPDSRFESMSFVVNILACKLKIVNNTNWKRHNKMVDRIRYPTVSYLPFYYVFFNFYY